MSNAATAPGVAIRPAEPGDAEEVAAIYGPIVRNTFISFELDPPSPLEMRERIERTLQALPWFVSLDMAGRISGYAYASRHRDRPAYQWSVDVSAYVRSDTRAKGVGKQLHRKLLEELSRLGYAQAFAGIALPNEASVGLHEAVGFKRIGLYRKVGFKLGAWHDVGWWQRPLRDGDAAPQPPRRFSSA